MKEIHVPVGLMLLIALGAVMVTGASGPIQTYDPYWLLALGRDYLSNLPVHIDQHSFTHFSEPLKGNYHLFGALFFTLSESFSLQIAAGTLRLLTVVACIGAAAFMLRGRVFHPLALAGLGLILLGLNYRLFLRPELIDYLFMGFSMLCVLELGDRFRWKTYWFVAGLMLTWTNLHAAVIGYVIFFGFYSQIFLNQLAQRKYRYIATFLIPSGLLLVGVGFINTDGQHPILAAMQFSPEWGEMIAEHQPFSTRFDRFSQIYFVWPLLMFALFILLATKEFGLAVTVLVFAVASWDRIRMLSFLVITVGYSLIIVSAKLQQHKLTLRFRFNPQIYFSAFALIIVSITTYTATTKALNINKLASNLPREETAYLKGKTLGGNVLNAMHYGGWLIYELAPNYKTHIDGRTNIVFPKELLQDSIAIANGDKPTISKHLALYDVDYILFPNKKSLFSGITQETDFVAEYISSEATLYSKTEQSLAVSNLILNFPMCWHPWMHTHIKKEAEYAVSRYPEGHSFLEFLSALMEDQGGFASNSKEFRGTLKIPVLKEAGQARALAYKALISEEYDIAVSAFGAVTPATSLDLITAAYASFRAKNKTTLEDLLLLLGSGYWEEVSLNNETPLTPSQVQILVNLVEESSEFLSLQKSDFEERDERTLLLKTAIDGLKEKKIVGSDALPFVYRQHCESLAANLGVFNEEELVTMQFPDITD